MNAHGAVVQPVRACQYCGRLCDSEILRGSGMTWIDYHEQHCAERPQTQNKIYLNLYAESARMLRRSIGMYGAHSARGMAVSNIRAMRQLYYENLPIWHKVHIDAQLDALGC